MKKWEILNELRVTNEELSMEDIISVLLKNRGFTSKKAVAEFLHPQDPYSFSAKEVSINSLTLKKALARIEKAIKKKESVVVYADYDADGITAGAIMWQTLHSLGAHVMPYIPHRVDEGYGLSLKGIDNVRSLYDPALIITVDHGITAWEKVAYAQKFGIEVIVTDHHVKPTKLPDCLIVHTTQVCGAGVSWFVAKELLKREALSVKGKELLALAAIGTIADMVPLVGPNRSIAKYGLEALNQTESIGLKAMIKDAGLKYGALKTYEISHMLAPRLNAMGRLTHALDALRLLCTKKEDKARLLAQILGLTNKERQQLMDETTAHAKDLVASSVKRKTLGKLIFVAHEEFNQGVIGLVAGKLVEAYYRPAIVLSIGEKYSKASARSVSGFNIIEAIRSCMDILVDAGGHPMAAGFTVETAKLELLKSRLEKLAEKMLDADMLTRVLKIDLELPLSEVSEDLWKQIQTFAPFGMSNPEPVFISRSVKVADARTVGAEGKHLKLRLKPTTDNRPARNATHSVAGGQLIANFDAIGFGLGSFYKELKPFQKVDVVYTIDLDTWNGNRKLQLKLKDVKIS